MARPAAPLAALFLLASCVGGGDHSPPVPQRPAGSPAITLNLPTSRETEACFADLVRDRVRYSPLPDRDYGGGCQQIGAVQLIDIGLPVTGLKGMQCPLARTFIAWLRNGVEPAAHQILGSDLVRVETFGTYSCRNIIGGSLPETAGKISEHAHANAVDVSGFVLADGRRITIARDWHSPDENVRGFLDMIHRSACRRFETVLSPDYNAAHYNHIHLDMGRGPFCR